MVRIFDKVKTERVADRIDPPESYLNFTIDWISSAPDILFDYNREPQDIYSWMAYIYNDWIEDKGALNFIRARKAAMLEILRTLGAMESSYDWLEDYHRGRNGDGPERRNWSAGMWQVAAISLTSQGRIAGRWAREHHGYLSTGRLTDADIARFRNQMKTDKEFAIEYTIRVIRQTYRHHGPLRRKRHNPRIPTRSSVHPFNSLEAAEEFYNFLA